jgi:hypothetical protein
MNFQGRRFRNGEAIYSEWFTRGGDNAIFRAEKINADVPTSGGITVTFRFYTKNRDEAGDGSIVKDSSNNDYTLQIAETDTTIQQVVAESTKTAGQGFEQLVRVKATVAAGGDDNWLLGRQFPPVWYDASTPA